jgi:hypothetical protein
MLYRTLTLAAACSLIASRLPEPLDACAVLTRADVTEVVGEEPRAPKPAESSRQLPGSTMEGSTCQYRGDGWTLRFFVERGHTKESTELTRKTLKGWQRVDGVGKEAYWGQSDPKQAGVMTAFDGPHAIVVNWFVRGDTPGPGTLEKTSELVRRAFKRL